MIGTPGLESAVARVSFVVFASTVQPNQYTPNPCPRHQNCAPESAENSGQICTLGAIGCVSRGFFTSVDIEEATVKLNIGLLVNMVR